MCRTEASRERESEGKLACELGQGDEGIEGGEGEVDSCDKGDLSRLDWGEKGMMSEAGHG